MKTLKKKYTYSCLPMLELDRTFARLRTSSWLFRRLLTIWLNLGCSLKLSNSIHNIIMCLLTRTNFLHCTKF
uniref:Uncharacterized protein n=1 Tax=Cannabis sativa TaxID=3483 RepID=A0A803RAJ9_CANSA